MPRTRLPVIAHLTPPGRETSPLHTALAALQEEVLRFQDPGSCLEGVPRHEPVVFLVERSALTRGGLMWLILLAEADRGPVVLFDQDDGDRGPALRAGVQRVISESEIASPSQLESLLLDCFAEFERRTPPETSPESLADEARVRRYVRDAVNEFRTPLTAIIEFASILADGIGGALNDKQQDYVRFVLEASDELEEHFDDFRTSLELQLDEPPMASNEFDLLYAVEEAVASVRTGRTTFRIDAPDRDCMVVGDRKSLVRAIARLAKRASKRSPKGSEVGVRLRPVAGAYVELALLDRGMDPAACDIELLDAGLVENGEHSKSVAQVFGLGVEVARAILEQHGVTLELTPREGGGSTAAFTLSLAPRRAG